MAKATRLHKRCMAQLIEGLIAGTPPEGYKGCSDCKDFHTEKGVRAFRLMAKEGREGAPERSCMFCGTPGEILPRYSNTHVDLGRLSGPEGNPYIIFGKVRNALRVTGANERELEEFDAEAEGNDYEDLLRTVRQWVWITMLP